MADDQSRSSLTREIGPDPLDEYAHAKARLREKLEMNPRPCEPCDEPGHLELSTLQDRKPFSNHGHVAFIEVPERLGRGLTSDSTTNQLSGVSPLLHCDLRYAGQRPAILIERSRVADHEDFRTARH